MSAAASTAGSSLAGSTGFTSAGAVLSEPSTGASSTCFCSATASVGVASFSAGVVITGVTAADCLSFSRFFSSVRKKAFRVVRSALFGLHRSGETGVCAHTEQVSGRDVWPREVQREKKTCQPELRHKKSIALTSQLTGLADRLVTARKAKSIHRQLVANGTSQLERNFVLGQSARCGRLISKRNFGVAEH